MIKIDKKVEAESYFKGEALFDRHREKEFKISIFGLSLFKKIEYFNDEILDDKNKKIGFTK